MQQLIVEVTPNLFIGSYSLVPPPDQIDKLVICSTDVIGIEELYPQRCVVYAPITPRMNTQEDFTTAVQTGRAVAGWTRRKKKVLVTCTTGRNRAGVVAAIAIMTYGIPSSEAITLVRAAVPDAIGEHYLPILRRLEDARDLRINATL
jgi:hypothetical protein